MTDNLQIVIPLFPKFTALDAIGPYEVLQHIPSIDVTFIGHQRGEIRTENGFLGVNTDATLGDFPEPDVVVFPGGIGTRPLHQDQEILTWVRRAHETTRWTCSVCTGSLVLGAAGLLQGLSATTHWACYPELAAHGAIPTAERVVEPRPADHHRGGRLQRHRHGPSPGRVVGRPHGSTSRPADDRV